MNNKLAENLKKIRKEHNLSQEQLAESLGVSRQAISKWESKVAYPEMEKIITICEKFNLNINDILNKDINEIKSEEESKKKVSKYIEDILNFITETISMFGNMNFKSKIKCIFEQCIILFAIYIILILIGKFGSKIVYNTFYFLPANIFDIMITLLTGIYDIFSISVTVFLMIYLFKTRYLEYYETSKEINDKKESLNTEKKVTEITDSKIKENKIIIRDPEHSKYQFLNSISKAIVFIVKVFLILPLFLLCLSLVGLASCFVLSFLVTKTGIFFIGLLILFLSLSIINIDFIIFILNFIFNRKNDKKKMIYSFIISVVFVGLSLGFISIGCTSFKYIENNLSNLKVETKEFEIKDNTSFAFQCVDKIEYIESNINNIKIEYSINTASNLYYHQHGSTSKIYIYTEYNDPIKLLNQVIENLNNKKIIPFNNEMYSVKIYASKDTLEKIKNSITIYNQG